MPKTFTLFLPAFSPPHPFIDHLFLSFSCFLSCFFLPISLPFHRLVGSLGELREINKKSKIKLYKIYKYKNNYYYINTWQFLKIESPYPDAVINPQRKIYVPITQEIFIACTQTRHDYRIYCTPYTDIYFQIR